MSRSTQRITKAVQSRGYQVKELSWEPIYYAGEMAGFAGGWTLVLDRPYVERTFPGDDLFGLSVEELLASIDHALTPEQPCKCDRSHHAVWAAGIIGDPQKTTHSPECEWHIKYRLRWWRAGR